MFPLGLLLLVSSLIAPTGPSITSASDDPATEVRRAEECFGSNDSAGAVEHATRAIEGFPPGVETLPGRNATDSSRPGPALYGALTVRAMAYCGRSDFAEALKDLDRAATLKEAEPDLYVRRAICRATLRDLDGAMEDLHRAARLDPGLTEACRLGTATLLAASRRQLDAIEVLREAPRAPGGERAADAFRAALKVDLRDLEGAMEDVDASLRAGPRNAECLTVRAMALLALGRPEDGLASSAESIAIDPHLAMARNTRAACLVRLGRLEEAEAELDRAIELKPGSMANYPARASVRASRGAEREALEDLSMADRFAPNSADSDRKRAAIFATSTDPAIRDVEKARALADRAVARTGVNPDSQAALSTVLAVQGDYPGALRAANVALENNERASLMVWSFQITPDRIEVEFTMRFRDEKSFDKKMREEIQRYRLLTSRSHPLPVPTDDRSVLP